MPVPDDARPSKAAMILRTRTSLARIGVLVLALFPACARERGAEPVPVDYRLYVGMDGHAPKYEAYVFAMDIATDSVVDSLGYANPSQIAWVTVSPDGHYMAIHASQPPVIWDLARHEVTAELPRFFFSVMFIPSDSIMLATTRDSTLVFSVPEFNLLEVIRSELRYARHIPGSNSVIGIYISDDTGGGPREEKLVIFDYRKREAVDSIFLDPFGDSAGSVVIDFDITRDGRRLYAIAYDRAGVGLTGYDLQKRRVLFRSSYNASGGVGACRLTPDGREVWTTHGATPFLIPWLEEVTIYDALTGAILETISVSDSTIGWPHRVSTRDIVFTPDGQRAYLACGMYFTGTQPLIVIDTKTRDIVKVLFDDATRIPSAVAIAPKP